MALPIVGGIVGEILSAPDREEAERLRRRAMAMYNIELPELDELQAQQLGPSAMEGVRGDPRAKALRMGALERLSQMGQEGYTAQDRAAINDVLSEVGEAERGGREAIMRTLPAGSGERTLALLSNQQAGAQRANRQGLQVAANSRLQALQALSGQGQLAGAIDEAEFNQGAKRAGAKDAIAEFNARNRWDTQRANIGQQQQAWENKLGLTDRQAGMQQDAATAAERESERKRRMWGSMGGQAQQGVLGYGQFRKGGG